MTTCSPPERARLYRCADRHDRQVYQGPAPGGQFCIAPAFGAVRVPGARGRCQLTPVLIERAKTSQYRVEVYGGILGWRALWHHVRNHPPGHDAKTTDLDAVSLSEFGHSLGLQAGIGPQRGRRRQPEYLDPLGADTAPIDEDTTGARDLGVDGGIAVVRAVAKVPGQRIERSIDRRIQATSAAWGGSRVSGLVAAGVNDRRGEAFEARVVDQRRGQHEAALGPAHPEQPPPDERLLRWEVQLPLLHGRQHARPFSAPMSSGGRASEGPRCLARVPRA